jgi:uncharacterized membrane protein
MQRHRYLLLAVLLSSFLPSIARAQTAPETQDTSAASAVTIDSERAGSDDGGGATLSQDDGMYERAIIRELRTGTESSTAGVKQQRQYVIELLSGSLKGQTRTISSDVESNPYQLNPAVGDRVVVLIQGHVQQGNEAIFLEGFDRRAAMFWLVILFVATLILLAGWQGFKVALSILASILLIGWILIPAFLKGLNPVPIAIALSTVLAGISSISATGWNKKSWVTVAGTLGGTIVAYIIAQLFSDWAHLGGLATEEDRLFFAKNPLLDPRGLLFAGIIIASMGVVEDVAVSIASGVFEVQKHNPRLTLKELFRSGMVIGRDHMSALANTLIFAYVGASLSTLLLYTQYGGSWLKFLNFDSVVDEVIRSLSGTIGLIFTVPITAILAAIIALRTTRRSSDQ